MEKVIQRYGKRTKVIWTNDENVVSTLLHTRGNAIFVSHNEKGFPLQSNESGFPGLKFCTKMTGDRVSPVCCEQAVWCTRYKHAPRSWYTGYYCNEHLDPELMPDRVQDGLFS